MLLPRSLPSLSSLPLRPTPHSFNPVLATATPLLSRAIQSSSARRTGDDRPTIVGLGKGKPGVGQGQAVGGKGGFLSSLLHGSEQAKFEGEQEVLQYSKLIGRNKYVHEMQTHAVMPSKREEYKKAAEKYFTGLANDPSLKVKLTGSWETLVGPVDNFVHILEYENYDGYDDVVMKLQQDSDLPNLLTSQILPTLHSRHTQLMSEFAFWPSSPPRKNGGIYELRSYQLIPGRLLEWENAWKRGLEARRRFVEPAGGWFSQVGKLHEVHHLWQYPNLAERKSTREQAWSVSGWSETVQETVKLAQSMQCSIMVPCSWSPLK